MSESDVNLETVLLNDSQSDWAIIDSLFVTICESLSQSNDKEPAHESHLVWYAGHTIYLLLRAHESDHCNTFYCIIFQCKEITFSSHLIQTASLKLN